MNQLPHLIQPSHPSPYAPVPPFHPLKTIRLNALIFQPMTTWTNKCWCYCLCGRVPLHQGPDPCVLVTLEMVALFSNSSSEINQLIFAWGPRMQTLIPALVYWMRKYPSWWHMFKALWRYNPSFTNNQGKGQCVTEFNQLLEIRKEKLTILETVPPHRQFRNVLFKQCKQCLCEMAQ